MTVAQYVKTQGSFISPANIISLEWGLKHHVTLFMAH